MKRALVVTLLLAIPVFAGFECQVDVTPWTVGGTCDYWLDYPADNVCNSATEVYYCSSDNMVVAWDCAAACDGGYCDYDATTGGDWCMCPDWQWAPGYTCDYWSQYDQSTCAGTELTYCAETNIIGSIDCIDQCASTVGSGATASCGQQPDTLYNGCVCEIDTCTFDAYCNDSLWIVQCSGGAESWTDCNDYCITEMGATKGVCDASVNACLCSNG
jgi:hypothetical protein